jgi:hypothetical protein
VAVVHDSEWAGNCGVVASKSIAVNAVPPNKWMELTGKNGTTLAKRRARVAPFLPAAHPGC